MELSYLTLGTVVLAAAALLALLWVGQRLGAVRQRQEELPGLMAGVLEEKHLAMIKEVNSGLNSQADRLSASQSDASERVRAVVSQDLKQTRDAMLVLQLSQTEELSATRETMSQRLGSLAADMQMKHDALRSELLTRVLERLAEQARAEQESIQTTLRNVSQHLATAIESLTKTTDARLEHISGKVTERLEEGFKKTNETFTNVMARLATIDEAQRKIDGLTTNVVSLQELLGDKRSRGAFGEVQLEALITNLLPPTAYVFQYTLSNGNRADCVLLLPEPTGMVALDSKFPLENYHRMLEPDAGEADRAQAQRQFRADVRRHVEDISRKYIVAGETSDGAVMFVPAEAVFAEIHAHHADVVDYAMQRRVWIVSPTTMMAVLNTARAVLKDVETRRQVHIIKDELSKLGREFHRFDQRMKKLADHIRQAHQDAEDVRVTSDKISRRFSQIERVELEQLDSVARLEQTLGEAEAPALPGQGG
ncbi:MAG TPA: DNA recombination protein RmuC [Burkholderiales bacterium]|nr:DNA recombination protein RmuC [Burkholderiales bacterium]